MWQRQGETLNRQWLEEERRHSWADAKFAQGATAFVDDDSGELLTVFGVDMLGDRGVRLSDVYGQDHMQIDDPLVFLNQPDSVIVTREFIERRGLQREGRIELVTPAGARSFTIRGVLDAKGPARALGGNVVIMDLYAAADAFLSEAILDGPRGKDRVVPFAREAFLLRRGNDIAIANQSGRTIVIVRGNSQNAHR